ncbi:MAG: hypothetical protein V8S93_10665 [Lachnospiraceae bacterium]
MCLKEDEKIRIEIPYIDKRVTLSARAFGRVGMYAYKQSSNGVNEKNSERAMAVLPAIVNLSLSCELYFKSYLSEESRKKDKHYLDELFEDLPKDIQKIIIARMIDEKIVNSAEEFNQKLKNMRKAFIEWRYYYELLGKQKEIDLQFLICLADTLVRLEACFENEKVENDA